MLTFGRQPLPRKHLMICRGASEAWGPCTADLLFCT